MTKIPPGNATSSTDPYAHGPIETAASRIPPSDYTTAFLSGLKGRNEVLQVDENWRADSAKLPAHITWVLHPNGDLERVGFN